MAVFIDFMESVLTSFGLFLHGGPLELILSFEAKASASWSGSVVVAWGLAFREVVAGLFAAFAALEFIVAER